MQLKLAFLDPAEPPPDPVLTSRPAPTTWDTIDEADRLAALRILAHLIARKLTDAPAKEASHE